MTCETPPFPFYDQIGNDLGYADESGAVAAAYEYDAYGNLLNSSGPLAAFFRHRFSTKFLDPDTGLCYYGYRWYSPELGRWISRDPIEEEGGENLYDFCSNESLNNVDSLGKNIYLLEGNKSGDPFIDAFHQSVAVDVWSKDGRIIKQTSFTFARTGIGLQAPSMLWLGTTSIVLPGILEGTISQRDPVGVIVAEKKTTCEEDRKWLSYMQRKTGKTATYSLLRHNCRTFSQIEFEAAPGKRIK